MIAAEPVADLVELGVAGRRRRRCRRSSVATTTTSIPAITALAALVPWALDGIRQTVRSLVAAGAVVGADRQQAGELALAAGVGLDADRVVAGDLGQPRLELGDHARACRRTSSAGANGCRSANSGHVIGTISVVALSFIVHEPSGIIVRSRARSRSARRRR